MGDERIPVIALYYPRTCLYLDLMWWVLPRKAKFLLPMKAATLHVSSVILWTNAMVMVFDEQGQQILELQGYFRDVRRRIDDVYIGKWEYGRWNYPILISDLPMSDHWRIVYGE